MNQGLKGLLLFFLIFTNAGCGLMIGQLMPFALHVSTLHLGASQVYYFKPKKGGKVGACCLQHEKASTHFIRQQQFKLGFVEKLFPSLQKCNERFEFVEAKGLEWFQRSDLSNLSTVVISVVASRSCYLILHRYNSSDDEIQRQ